MSSQNQVSVCNLSLLAIGGKVQISTITENSTQANACKTLYSFTFQQLARAAYWNCLRKQTTNGLTLLQAAAGTPENPNGTTLPLPPVPYLYAYQVPSDSLACRWIVPSIPAMGSNPISPTMVPAPIFLGQQRVPFQVSTGVDANNQPLQLILTNLSKAQLVYTVDQQNPALWDSDFTAAFVASLAAYLTPALAMNKTLMQTQIGVAERIINQARVRDANEGSTSQDHVPDFIRAREAGSGWGSSGIQNQGYIYGDMFNYCNMSW